MGYEVRTEVFARRRDDVSDGGPRWKPFWSGRIVFVEADGKETCVPRAEGERAPEGDCDEEGEKAVRAELSKRVAHLEHDHKTTGRRWELEPERAKQTARQTKYREELEAKRRQEDAEYGAESEC